MYILDNEKEYIDILSELSKVLEIDSHNFKIKINKCDNGFIIDKNKDNVTISVSDKRYFARALSFVVQHSIEENYKMFQNCAFEDFSIMLDNSRNGVMTTSSVKNFVLHMALLGYSRLMLYLEDTYEVKEEPYLGQYRGRFTAIEINEIEKYCDIFGIELSPCIQTLGHLNAPFKWWWYAGRINDCNDILLIGDDETYKFLDNCISSISKMFKSKKINIGLDEANMMGLGKYLKKFGYRDRFELFNEHLKKVEEICNKYGLQISMWSDMFFKLVFDCGDYEIEKDIPQELIDKIPKNIGLIYWDYWHNDYNLYKNMIIKHQSMSSKIAFAGSAMTATGMVPQNRYSFTRSIPAIKACLDTNVKEAIVTVWGDDGQEASRYSVLPVYVLWAEMAYGQPYDMDSLNTRTKICYSADIYDFFNLDTPNELYDINEYNQTIFNSESKYLLFNDPLIGLYDSLVTIDVYNDYYKKYYQQLEESEKRNPKWSFLFKSVKALCKCLSYKCDLGVRLKTYYDKGDNIQLSKICYEELDLIIGSVKELYNAQKAQWDLENKVFGFEVQDIRYAGLIKRLEVTKEKLQNYLDGKITTIDELAQPRLPFTGEIENVEEKRHINSTYWRNMVTTSIL